MTKARVNETAVVVELCRPGGAVEAEIMRRSQRVLNRARELCPVDTGRLRSSLTARIERVGGVPVGIVGTNVSYAKFVHDGTGIYGPRHRRIVPVRAKALAWTGKDGKTVFARSVRGMKPRPFLRDALEAV